MPDIEKRLEAFVRVGHGIIVFPEAQEQPRSCLYLVGHLMHPDNTDQPMPLILTGPESSRALLEQLDAFVGATLGDAARAHYQLIIDDPVKVAQLMTQGFNRYMTIEPRLRMPLLTTGACLLTAHSKSLCPDA